MSEQQTRLAEAGVVLGAVFGLSVLVAIAGETDKLAVAGLAGLVPAGLGILQLGLRDEAQVRWFRRALFAPYASAIGAVVLVLVTFKVWGGRPPEPFESVAWPVLLAALAAFVFSPPIWLLRALHLWFANRETRRLMSAAARTP